MRIGFDAKRYFHNYTGLGNYSRTLIQNLAHYYPDHEYYLYTQAGSDEMIAGAQKEYPSCYVQLPPKQYGKIRGSLWRTFLMPDQLNQDNLDIYHGLSHEIPYKIHEKADYQIVVTIHDLIFMRHPEFYRWGERQVYTKKYGYACEHADKIIAVSEQTKNDIVEYFHIPAEKVETIYQSCDDIFYQETTLAEREQIKQKYQLPENYILYVGSFNERKNITSLVHAVDRLGKTLDVPLVLLGGGRKYKQEVEKLIAELGLQKKVMIVSGIPNEDLPGIYQAASLFVYPSIYEGFGIPIIEALISGIPVVTSKGGCFPEAGGPNTVYVDPLDIEELSDAMERVLTDQEKVSEMVSAGKEYVSRFQKENTTNHLERFYRSLL